MSRCLKLHLDVKIFEACPMRNSSKGFIIKELIGFLWFAIDLNLTHFLGFHAHVTGCN